MYTNRKTKQKTDRKVEKQKLSEQFTRAFGQTV